jgi:hypothetical protein
MQTARSRFMHSADFRLHDWSCGHCWRLDLRLALNSKPVLLCLVILWLYSSINGYIAMRRLMEAQYQASYTAALERHYRQQIQEQEAYRRSRPERRAKNPIDGAPARCEEFLTDPNAVFSKPSPARAYRKCVSHIPALVGPQIEVGGAGRS